ncbi:MAG: ATP-binding protein [Anaerolineales bacterium]|nr:ATP-binding protein [Anaerolineales bacterium]
MTTAIPASRTIYTHSPALHRNILIASLQLVAWILFHPSAWNNYIKGLDVNLSPDFTILDLGQKQLNNSHLRHLLFCLFLIWPVLVLSFVFIALIPFPIAIGSMLFGLEMSLGAFIGTALTTSLGGSVRAAYVAIPVGIVIGLTSGITGQIPMGSTLDNSIGIIFLFAYGLGGNLLIYDKIDTPTLIPKFAGQQVGGILLGSLVGAIIGGITYLVAVSLTSLFIENSIREIGLISGIFMGGVTYLLAVALRKSWRGAFLAFLVYITITIASLLLSQLFHWEHVQTITAGLMGGIWFTSIYILSNLLSKPLAGAWAGAIAGAVAGLGFPIIFWLVDGNSLLWLLPLGGLAIFAGFTFTWWLPTLLAPILIMWGTILYYLDSREATLGKTHFSQHPVFWVEFPRWRWPGLVAHLLLLSKKNQQEYSLAKEHLATSHQNWAVQIVQLELAAQLLADCQNVYDISLMPRNLANEKLEGLNNETLKTFEEMSNGVAASLKHDSSYYQRSGLTQVIQGINKALNSLAISKEPSASRFLPILRQWGEILSLFAEELLTLIEQEQEIENPYYAGNPVAIGYGNFVGRRDISQRIEKLLMDPKHPPLLLYGQRRMGKTSLLQSLHKLLPYHITPIFIDLQKIAAAETHRAFLEWFSNIICTAALAERHITLPTLSFSHASGDAFLNFDKWLDTVEATAQAMNMHTMLLELDEFEILAQVLQRNRLDLPSILGMLRHIIQHRPFFKVLLSGSHTLSEFEQWATYFINAQVIHISYLKKDEACQLVKNPIPNFLVQYQPDALQRILSLTRCHPYLLQLLCSEIVILKNEQSPQSRRLVTVEDVENAITSTLRKGWPFFTLLSQNATQLGSKLLLQMALHNGTLSHIEIEHQIPSHQQRKQIIKKLIQQEAIELTSDGYRFQIELVQQWFIMKNAFSDGDYEE